MSHKQLAACMVIMVQETRWNCDVKLIIHTDTDTNIDTDTDT